jgi:hypothetical protein
MVIIATTPGNSKKKKVIIEPIRNTAYTGYFSKPPQIVLLIDNHTAAFFFSLVSASPTPSLFPPQLVS